SRSREDQLSARLLFLAHVDPALARRVLERWQGDLWVVAKTLERARETALLRNDTDPTAFPTLPLALGRRLRHVAADLAHAEEPRAALEQWLGDAGRAPRPAETDPRVNGDGHGELRAQAPARTPATPMRRRTAR